MNFKVKLMTESNKRKKKRNRQSALKSRSGEGFVFEDYVAAILYCEMLTGTSSIDRDWGIIEKIEHQVAGWEPLGDLFLTVSGNDSQSYYCPCSIKSNRPINYNGCNKDLSDALWKIFSLPSFRKGQDKMGIFCAPLGKKNKQLVDSLRSQSQDNDPVTLDQKLEHNNILQIYRSFHNPSDSGPDGLPGHVLKHIVLKEFEFEGSVPQDGGKAIRLCIELLKNSEADRTTAIHLWNAFIQIATQMRVNGGTVTRESLTKKLRNDFSLKDDFSDRPQWHVIKTASSEWLNQIRTMLPNGQILPRTEEIDSLREAINKQTVTLLLGQSGCGKSALAKMISMKAQEEEHEVVWIKAENFAELKIKVPDIADVLARSRRSSGLLVIDSVENCYAEEHLDAIRELIEFVTPSDDEFWKVVIVCQISSWRRVLRRLIMALSQYDSFPSKVECDLLSDSDFALVCSNAHAINKLDQQDRLKKCLRSPKMLDLLLRNKAADFNPSFIGEADIVDWWWIEQVKGGKNFAGEEKVVQSLAIHFADSLTSEASPEIISDHQAADSLSRRQILIRTTDGRVRFDHDLLADWSRVMYLRSFNRETVLDFMRQHSENPPWLRAIRIFSQHLLDRDSDHERWRSVVKACTDKISDTKQPSAHDMLILDEWLEGIAYCHNPKSLLDQNRTILFEQDGQLIERLLRRLLHSATWPDPVIQRQFREIEDVTPEIIKLAESRCRLPMVNIWQPFISFVVENSEEITDSSPLTLAEIGMMWARICGYWNVSWKALADVMLLNGEKELRYEVAGNLGLRRRIVNRRGQDNDRVTIYSAMLYAASQNHERGANLALKAAGRKDWEEGDLSEDANGLWRGEWRDDSFFGGQTYYEKQSVESWPDGPKRRVSHDFFRACFMENAALPLFKVRPEETCEAILGLLLDWPKKEIVRGQHYSSFDHPGFRSDTMDIFSPFWFKGPFITYMRENWHPALDFVIRFVNFATDRYCEWWSYDPPVADIEIPTQQGKILWKGNNQVYNWNHYHMNTHPAVTCALMALEKWLDEQVVAKNSITDVINLLYQDGKSIAFANVLICIGKRHPFLFKSELKPLLFVPDIYTYDLQYTYQNVPLDWGIAGEFHNNLRREWDKLPGRKTWLKKICLQLVIQPGFKEIFEEISTTWNNEADVLPEHSTDRKNLIRFATEFNPNLWVQKRSEGGRTEFVNEELGKLRDVEVERDLVINQALLLIPVQCCEWFQQRPDFDEKSCEDIWNQLQNSYSKRVETLADQESSVSRFHDVRHMRAGMIAILVCLGEPWLEKHPKKMEVLDKKIREILRDPPEVDAYTPEDILEDWEAFLARAVVRRWAAKVNDREWRNAVANFVIAYRYLTIKRLFEEAFRCRRKLKGAYRELEGLVLAFSVVRNQVNRPMVQNERDKVNDVIGLWIREWLPKFEKGEGPRWVGDWTQIEIKHYSKRDNHSVPIFFQRLLDNGTRWFKRISGLIKFKTQHHAQQKMVSDFPLHMLENREKPRRAGYDLNMEIVLAAFGHFPALSEAIDKDEREHWLSICREMLAAYCRTLPSTNVANEDEWSYDIWPADDNIFSVVSARIFECSKDEGRELWKAIIDLPPAAHHHISRFLYAILRESLRTDPPQIEKLIEVWVSVARHLNKSEIWTIGNDRNTKKVWKTILLFDTYIPSIGTEAFAPLVQELFDYYRNYVESLGNSANDHVFFVDFLRTKAATPIFIDALVWLHGSWEHADDRFWKSVTSEGQFESFLEFAWSTHFSEIRKNQSALSAFKTLILHLATHNIAAAIRIQNQI